MFQAEVTLLLKLLKWQISSHNSHAMQLFLEKEKLLVFYYSCLSLFFARIH